MPELTVNGARHELSLDPERSLLQVLREELGLTGAKYACGEGACGACTVLLDGDPVFSCVTPVGDAIGRVVITVEGLGRPGGLHPVQRAFVDVAAMQCGYCTPGMVVRAAALLERTDSPREDDIRASLQGNVCRCCTYPRIVDAVRRAARDGGDTETSPSVDESEPASIPGRPRAPWDLTAPKDRDWFEVLPPGLVVVVPPDAVPEAWTAGGGAWVHAGEDRMITAFTGKVDVGQGNRTGLSILVAEELGVAVSKVRLVMGDTDVCPFDMGTFGSRSTADAGPVLRAAAAAARRLIDGGADLAKPRVETVTEPPPQDAARGRRTEQALVRRAGATETVTGATKFGTDITLPDMLHGARLRPPRVGASLRSVDTSEAERLPGVTVVREGDLVGAVADDPPGAVRAVAAMRADWETAPQPSERDLSGYLRSHPAEIEGWGGSAREEHGDVDAAIAGAEVRLESTYTTAYVAHTPLETRVAVANWDDGRLTVWTGTQVPFGVRADVADRLGVPEEDVRVIVPPTGGGFGGKHTVETAVEAATFARATGKPVKVRWSRREEFEHGYFRPAAVVDVRSGAARDGTLLGWDFVNVNSGSAGIACPYEVADRRIEFRPAESPLAQGSYRALAATANTFARESHVDEIAVACGVDPVELRTRHLRDERLAAVLHAAAEQIGWGSSEATLGIACGVEKDARVGTAVRLHIDGARSVIDRIVTAFDCGAVVDPDNLRNQIEGATVMGLGGALFEAVRFEDGCILNGSMTDYRVPRFQDVPSIEVILLDRPDLPSAGAGETPIIAVAPAIANGLFAATGERVRSLPLLPSRA
jgi:CO/xanthine dehydrogenase Mo-binding subunit/aerobic-type carbon monoxide dehydrogenase small subunit (CoxS/CutS family)